MLEVGVETTDDVRAAGRALAGFSPEMAAGERQLKAFLYARMYKTPERNAVAAETQAPARRACSTPIATAPRCSRPMRRPAEPGETGAASRASAISSPA